MARATLHIGSTVKPAGTSRLAFGEIYLLVDDRPFPSEAWTDFVVPVAYGWVSALNILLTGAATAQVDFMDGPFQVNLGLHDPETWRLDLIERRRSGRRVNSETVEKRPLIASVLDVAHALHDTLAASAVSDDNIPGLFRAAARLEERHAAQPVRDPRT